MLEKAQTEGHMGTTGRQIQRLQKKYDGMDGRTKEAKEVKRKLEAIKKRAQMAGKLLGNAEDLNSL